MSNQEAGGSGSGSAPKRMRTYIPPEREEAEQRLIDYYFGDDETPPKLLKRTLGEAIFRCEGIPSQSWEKSQFHPHLKAWADVFMSDVFVEMWYLFERHVSDQIERLGIDDDEVVFAGLMAGLTLGLMSLGLVDLEVLMQSGRPKDRLHASKIFPVVKNQHLLLCTLLIGNALAMESLPIFLDKLVPPWAAVLISVTLILMFGEILPQAICTRYGLTVGATMAPFVRCLLFLFFPISYPISKVLDWMLGKGHAALLRRAELKTFVNFHGNEVV
ncbi:DUF21 domain-containing protein [Tanacetum coccineum]